MQTAEKKTHFGVLFPDDTIERIEQSKGRYMSRNQYMLQIIETLLDASQKNENTNKTKELSGSELYQAEEPT